MLFVKEFQLALDVFIRLKIPQIIVVNCSYHPNENAIGTCERCRRYICARDKRIYRKRRSSGAGNHRHSWTETYEYCLPCHSDASVSDSYGGMVMGVIVIVFGLFFAIGSGSAGAPFIFPLFGILFVVFGLYSIVSGPQMAAKFNQDKDNFLTGLKKQPTGIEYKKLIPAKKLSFSRKPAETSIVHCFQCGTKIDLNHRFCMACGDPTKDEKEFLEDN